VLDDVFGRPFCNSAYIGLWVCVATEEMKRLLRILSPNMILFAPINNFALSSAQWIAQDYSGKQHTGQRLASVDSSGSDVEWDCVHLNNIGGQATSLLISVNDDAAESYRSSLNKVDGACDSEVFGGINCKQNDIYERSFGRRQRVF
jgi:hypothetical protein